MLTRKYCSSLINIARFIEENPESNVLEVVRSILSGFFILVNLEGHIYVFCSTVMKFFCFSRVLALHFTKKGNFY